METAGEGGATIPSAYGVRGGVGGKFRKRPFRRTTHATPYDRPPTTLSNSSDSNANTGGWLSKLVVSPASKLFSSSANYLFSSVLRKRLPLPLPPLPPSETSQEQRDGSKAASPITHGQEACTAIGSGSHTNNSDDSGISELEQILRKKSFTRSEIDRLTKLLHSRTADLSDDGRTHANLEVNDFERPQGFTCNVAKDKIESGVNGIISTTLGTSEVLEEDVASPAEIAKAYMGNRSAKVSPSVLSFRSQALGEDMPLQNNSAFPLKSAIISPSPRTPSHAGFSRSSFTTPRSRGRSVIYSMARTPYSKFCPDASQKDVGCKTIVNSRTQSSSKIAEELGAPVLPKQTLKRRSVLEDEIGYLRRVRKKPNVLSERNMLSTFGVDTGSVSRCLPSLAKKPVFFDHSTSKVPNTLGQHEANNIPGTSHASVPSKSSEMAAKILEHLEKLTPKGKPSEASRSSNSGSAIKSLDGVDSCKLLYNGGDVFALKNSPNELSYNRDSTSEKQEKAAVDTNVSAKDAKPSFISVGDTTMAPIAQPQQKKWAFQISAPEDSVEMDDEWHSNVPTSTLLAEIKTSADTAVNEAACYAKADGLVGEKKNSFIFSSSASSKIISQSSVLGQSALEQSKFASLQETNSSLGLNLSSKGVDNVLTSGCSSAAFVNKSANSFASAQPKTFERNKIETLHTEKAGDAAGMLRVPSTVGSISALTSCANNSSSCNGSLVSGSNTSTLPALSSSNSMNQIATSGSPSIGPSVSGAASDLLTSTSSFSVFAVAASSASPSIFKFGSPMPSNSDSTLATPGSGTSKLNGKSQQEEHICASGFGSASFAVPNGFGLGLSGTSTSNTEPQGAPSGIEDGSGSSLASASVLSAATVSQSTPVHFGSSTSSSVLGTTSVITSSNSPLTASAPKFGTGSDFGINLSSSSGVKSVNTSDDAFGANSSGSTSMTNSIGANTLATSSVFNLDGSSIASGSTFNNPSNGSTSGVSPFGVSMSSGLSATNPSNTGIPSIFSLGGSSLDAAPKSGSGSSVAATPVMFPFSAKSLTASSDSTCGSLITSAAPNVSPFGAKPLNASSESTSGSLFNSASPDIFAFGKSLAASGESSTGGISTSASPGIFSYDSKSMASSTGTNSVSSSSGVASSSVFGSAWQPNIFASNSSSTPAFSFGASSSSAAAAATAPNFVAASNRISSVFSTTSASNPATTSLPQSPLFGNSAPVFTASPGNNDQMNMEDSMAEDHPAQATTAAPPSVFGQPPTQVPFMFGSTPSSPAPTFQFGGQQNHAAGQNFSTFQPPNNGLEFSAAGSFSVGSNGGGGDKSNRKIIKVNRNKNRRK